MALKGLRLFNKNATIFSKLSSKYNFIRRLNLYPPALYLQENAYN